VLLLHWSGGRHSELRIKKNVPGKHGRCTSVKAIEVIRQMAGKFSDEQMAATLNRLGLRTGTGHTWTEGRVRSARQYNRIPACRANHNEKDPIFTLEETAERLGVSTTVVRRMIREKKLPATQVVACAPWQISAKALETETVQKEVRNIRDRVRAPRTQIINQQQAMFSGM
jgi:excisionase family DNA binding protein